MAIKKVKHSKIFWCTGLSGSGKSTLAEHAKAAVEKLDFSVLIVDGDTVREAYKKKLGFSKSDIQKNNSNIANICKSNREDYDVIIVPIISPSSEVRSMVRKMLLPDFYLIYISSDIESLRERDPKGLYKSADLGKITNLIGYSKLNPYEVPLDADLIIDTSKDSDIRESKRIFANFISDKISIPS